MVRRCESSHLVSVPCILEKEKLDFICDLSVREPLHKEERGSRTSSGESR